jgi:hypothetical protein
VSPKITLDSLATGRTRGDQLPPVGEPLDHNAHVHLPPNFSAFETVEQAVRLGAEQGLSLLCASNYYDHRVYDSFAALCLAEGIFACFGLEIISLDPELAARGVRVNDPGNPGRFYALGLGTAHIVDPPPAAREVLEGIRTRDEARMAEMVARVNGTMAERGVPVELSVDGIIRALVERHGVEPRSVVLQERHVVQALQEALFAAGGADPSEMVERAAGSALAKPSDPVAVQNDLRGHLLKAGKPGYVEEQFVEPEAARRTVLGLGGIPCYPVLGDGAKPLTEFEADPQVLAHDLLARGFHMAQFIPRRNELTFVEHYAEELHDAGIVLTVGTEHNTLELIPLRPAAKGPTPLTPRLRELFWEGACVTAAHQVLVARGEVGYVGPDGGVAGSTEQLARFGDAVIREVSMG